MSEMDWTVLPSPCDARERKMSEGSASESQRKQATHHLICEDSIDTLFVQVGEPIESLELILFERTSENLGLFDEDVTVH